MISNKFLISLETERGHKQNATKRKPLQTYKLFEDEDDYDNDNNNDNNNNN